MNFLLALLLLVPSPVAPVTTWRTIAVNALAAFKRADTGNERANAYAWAMEAELRLNGLTPYARTLFAKVMSLRNADGGWGLPFEFDALSDGTLNAVTTTYTVSNVGHVGPPMLLAYRMGMAEAKEPVTTIVRLTMSTARLDNAVGACVAYSRNANDAKPYGCVHNVNAGAGAFLLQANAAGLGRSGLTKLVQDITRREIGDFKPSIVCAEGQRYNWWLYMGTSRCNDTDHNSYSAESMYVLAPAIGSNTAYMHMTTSYTDANAAIAHMRLTSVWCVLGANWIPEVEAYAQGAPTDRAAQIAQGAARNVDNCEKG